MKTKMIMKALAVFGFTAMMGGFSLPVDATTFTYSQSTGFEVDTSVTAGRRNPITTWSGNLLSNDPNSPRNDIKWYSLASAPVDEPTGTYDTIAWGNSNNASNATALLLGSNPIGNSNYSALQVLGQKGSVSTGAAAGSYGNWVTISTLTHQNNAISSTYYTLESAIIFSNLQIGSYASPSHEIPISFVETLNQSPCTAGTNPNGSVCDDRFTFPNVSFVHELFSIGGIQYEAEFQLANFVNSKSDYPDYDALGNSTVYTAENKTSKMDVQMAIREVATPVPEPGTMMLLGVGMLGLAVFGKRRMNKGA